MNAIFSSFSRTSAAVSLVAALSGACGGPVPVAAPDGQPPAARKVAEGRYEVHRAWLDGGERWFGKDAEREFSVVTDGVATGVRLAGFRAGSRADQVGLEEGDVLRAVDGRAVESVEAAVRGLQGVAASEIATLELTRHGQPITLIFQVR